MSTDAVEVQAVGLAGAQQRLGPALEHHARVLAAATSAGLLLAFVINGWGTRLAMLLLARLNPQVTGQISDDGFVMGQFTKETIGLVGFGTFTGIIGAVAFLAIRHLRFGPRWWRVTSMAVGPAIVVGNMLVHTDGIDFRVLEPRALAIALFVVLPGAFAVSLALLVDRWTEPNAWFLRGSRWKLLALVPMAVIPPMVLVAAPVVLLPVLNERKPDLQAAAADGRFQWLVRAILTAIFLGSLASLTQKTIELL